MTSFQPIRSETLLKGRVFAIRRDLVRTPDGREVHFDVIDHGGSVVIVPLDSEGNLVLVRQYRHATGRELIELPAGTLDGEEAPEVCAARELREETGLAAGRLERIGEFFLAPGYSTEYMFVYLASELTRNPLKADEDEFLQVLRMPLGEALSLAETGGVPDAKSLAALYIARRHMNQH